MTALALALVLSSAVCHATWNLYAKRASGGPAFTFLFDWLSVGITFPLALAFALREPPRLGGPELVAVLGSAVLHLGYFLLLGQGYRWGDLSLVYPLARGLGPMLSTAAAVLLLGERPTPLALAGAALIGLGVVVLAGDPRRLRASGAGRSVAYALLTGVLIAAYTLWDKRSVSREGVGMAPVLYFWGFTTLRAVLLVPFGVRLWPEVQRHWRVHRPEALGIAILNPASYILMLVALSFSPVSYVAPAREIGILIGAVLGARLLAEQGAPRRLAAAAAMVAGVVALAIG